MSEELTRAKQELEELLEETARLAEREKAQRAELEELAIEIIEARKPTWKGMAVVRLTQLLNEALDEYADHQAWRCDHPDRYPHDPDCPCGLVEFQARARAVLGAVAGRKADPEGAELELKKGEAAEFPISGTLDDRSDAGGAAG